MMSQREEPGDNERFRLTMHPRPREEFYDLKKDPDQLVNLAADPQYASVLSTLRTRVDKVMNATSDPRIKDAFDRLPWVDSTKQ